MRKLLCVIPLWAAITACDLVSGATSIALLTKTPRINPGTELPADLYDKLPLASEEMAQINNAVALVVGLVNADASNQEAPATPIAGAQVTVSWGANTATACETSQPGAYVATNVKPPEGGEAQDDCVYVENFDYVGKTGYAVDLLDPATSQEYSISFTAPAAVEAGSVKFLAGGNELGRGRDLADLELRQHTLNAELTVDWSGDADASRLRGAVSVFRLELSCDAHDATCVLNQESWTLDQENNPVHHNIPTDVGALVKLVTATPEKSETIPGTVFSKSGLYLIALAPTEVSTTTSNLSIASGALAGIATLFVVWVPAS